MPRLPTNLITKAHRVSPLVALLLRACRDIPSAKNELRWISEHVSRIYTNNTSYSLNSASPSTSTLRYHEKLHLYKLCKSRSRGVPLQYILGTQPFGDLEIKCRRGVLIPRSETEAYTLDLSRILLDEIRSYSLIKKKKNMDERRQQVISNDDDDRRKEKPKPMRILDICSGTGCISLQLYAQLRHVCPDLGVVGLDVSQKAIDLSRENIRYNNLQSHDYNSGNENGVGDVPRPRPRQSISYHRGDLFSPSSVYINDLLGLGPTALEHSLTPNSGDSQQQQQPEELGTSKPVKEKECEWDLIISNPPYISSKSFSRDTTRSVRNFEPKLALVPDEDVLSTSVSTSKSTPMEPSKRSLSLVSSCQPEDIFYARILDLFFSSQAQQRQVRPPKRILFEVADLEQASRVVEMMVSVSASVNVGASATIEIWRDDPSSSSSSPSYYLEAKEGDKVTTTKEAKKSVIISGKEIPIRGAGYVRSVYFFAGTGTGTGERK